MVVENRYVPARGDLVWLHFNPQSGHEQSGRRPAVVLSPRVYNEKVGLALFCPVTSKRKGYPFEVALPPSCSVHGVILSDQLKSFDWRARAAEYITSLPQEVIGEVLRKIRLLLED
jgi:mRNA interferase MazF